MIRFRPFALIWILALAFGLLALRPALAGDAYSFGVLSQRSPVLTAEFWNPILGYLSRKAGVPIRLMVARTGPESNQAIEAGDYDFVYSNTIFQSSLARAGYQVILRPKTAAITGQIVTLAGSSVATVADLQGQVVGFPSQAAFVGYAVPMDHLLREKVSVQPVFGGNQEGIMGQLKAGRVVAAGVNSEVMKAFAAREGVAYRVLWQSSPFHNIPVAVHPRVPTGVATAVQQAFAAMDTDPEGAKILADSGALIGQAPPLGYVASTQADYASYVDFYRTTLVTDIK